MRDICLRKKINTEMLEEVRIKGQIKINLWVSKVAHIKRSHRFNLCL